MREFILNGPPVRSDEYVTVEFAPNDPAEGGILPVSYDVDLDGGLGQARYVIPSIGNDIFLSIGRIIANWSVLESVIDAMTAILHENFGSPPRNWRRQNASQRIQMHQGLFEAAFGSRPRIFEVHSLQMEAIWRLKPIRDSVAHRQVMGSAEGGVHGVIFADQAGQFVKPYRQHTAENIHNIAQELAFIAGVIEVLAEAPDGFLPSDDISALRHALGSNRWNLARMQALQPQP